jgi:alcohol dehydrogenase class IV
MMLGTLQAGLAFSNSSVTLVHGMSRPLGRYNIPHRMANAQLVVPITDFSYSGPKEHYEIAKNVLYPNDNRNIVTYLSDLVDENEYNKNIPNMVSEAIKSGSPANNPRSITSQEMEILYNFKT